MAKRCKECSCNCGGLPRGYPLPAASLYVERRRVKRLQKHLRRWGRKNGFGDGHAFSLHWLRCFAGVCLRMPSEETLQQVLAERGIEFTPSPPKKPRVYRRKPKAHALRRNIHPTVIIPKKSKRLKAEVDLV